MEVEYNDGVDQSGSKEDVENKLDDVQIVDSNMGLFKKSEDEKGLTSADPKSYGHPKKPHDNHHVHFSDPDDDPPPTFRQKVKAILHNHKFHLAVIALVAIDCALVVAELIVDYEELSSGSNCSDHEGDPKTPLQKTAEALHILSLIILSVFMVELAVKLFALGAEFFHSKLEMFDGVVIVVSFLLDIFSLVYEEWFVALDLIVILRLWRIVRVVNGVILSVEEKAEDKIKHYKKVRMRAMHALNKFEEYSTELEKIVEEIKGLLGKSGIQIDDALEVPERPQYDQKLHLDLDHHGNENEHHENENHVTDDDQPECLRNPPDYKNHTGNSTETFTNLEAEC